MFDMEILNNSSLNCTGNILGLKKSQVANLRAGTRELTTLEVLLLKQASLDQELLFFNWRADELLFWTQVEKLQADLEYDDLMMASTFSTPLRNFRFARSRAKSLPWSSCNFFYMKFKIHPALWFSEDFDTECLAKNIRSVFKNTAYLPQIFEGGGSKMRTLSNSIQFVAQTWGENYSRALINSLQITPESLAFPEKSISLRVFATIHKKLRAFGAQDEHFIGMGAFNRTNERNRRMFAQHIPEKLSKQHEIMNYFVSKMINRVDVNKNYSVVAIDKHQFKAIAKPTETFTESFLPDSPFSEYEIALFALGHFKILPTYFGFPELQNISIEFDQDSGIARYFGDFS